MIKSTTSTQDYLKAIYHLAVSTGIASTTALAAHLGISPASVTGMIQKMASSQPPLVTYKKYQGVTLTQAGERAALEVIRRHRLLEAYLVRALGYSWDHVHDEACRLEHVISEEFEERVADLLGHPSRDPHGDPIPGTDLKMPVSAELPLSELKPGQRAIIRRVKEDPGFLRHVQSLGLVPGVTIAICGYSPFDQNLTLEMDDHIPLLVGLAVTTQIFVEVV